MAEKTYKYQIDTQAFGSRDVGEIAKSVERLYSRFEDARVTVTLPLTSVKADVTVIYEETALGNQAAAWNRIS